MKPAEAMRRIIEAADPPMEPAQINVTRRRLMEVACQVVGDEPCAAFLWLYDRDQNILDLGHQFTTACSEGSDPDALTARSARPRAPGVCGASASEPEMWEISLSEQPKIGEWCREQEVAGSEYAYTIRSPSAGHQDDGFLGVLQIITPTSISDEDSAIMSLVAGAFALMIPRCREQRRLWALQRMQSRVDLTGTIDACFSLAAETLHYIAGGEICAVYRQERDLRLRCVAASAQALVDEEAFATPESVTSRMLGRSKPARLSDFEDDVERERELGTRDYDRRFYAQVCRHLASGRFHAVMFAPVRVGDHPVAVVHLLNKPDYLARKFSRTDEAILVDVCEFLSRVTPSVETRRVMIRITETVFSGALRSRETRSQEAHRALFELLADMIPGVASAALAYQTQDSGSSEVLPLGGKEWFRDAATVQPTTDVAPMREETTPSSGRDAHDMRYQYVASIPGLEHGWARLAIGLRRSSLSDYEEQLLFFVCKELSQVLRGEELQQRSLHDIIQFGTRSVRA